MTAPTLLSDDPTPAGRRDRAAALVLGACPAAGPPALDTEPADVFGGPWESAIWRRGDRRVRVTFFRADTTLIHRDAPGMTATELYRRPCDGRVLAALAWLLEG